METASIPSASVCRCRVGLLRSPSMRGRLNCHSGSIARRDAPPIGATSSLLKPVFHGPSLSKIALVRALLDEYRTSTAMERRDPAHRRTNRPHARDDLRPNASRAHGMVLLRSIRLTTLNAQPEPTSQSIVRRNRTTAKPSSAAAMASNASSCGHRISSPTPFRNVARMMIR